MTLQGKPLYQQRNVFKIIIKLQMLTDNVSFSYDSVVQSSFCCSFYKVLHRLNQPFVLEMDMNIIFKLILLQTCQTCSASVSNSDRDAFATF